MKNISLNTLLTLSTIVFVLFLGSNTAAGDKKTAVASRLPIARIGESIIACPLDSVTLDGWGSIDIGGEVVGWLWDINGDGKTDTTTDRGELTFTVAPKFGSTTVILTVKDNDNNISEPVSSLVNVMKSNPVVAMAHDTVIKLGVRLSFEPVVRTNCGSMKKYEWDFNDDGTPDYISEESPKTSRIYFKPGRYSARFKVTDCFGRCAGGIQLITVK